MIKITFKLYKKRRKISDYRVKVIFAIKCKKTYPELWELKINFDNLLLAGKEIQFCRFTDYNTPDNEVKNNDLT